MENEAAATGPLPELVLVTKTGCHLCEDARAVVAGVSAAVGLPWTERLIDDDAALARRFAEEVPVVLVDGVQRDFWHIDAARLTRILTEAMGSGH
ncbi:glutaredoxin family protein [Specibacter cremeus]|uniref:glutaredoxin family protein n=1 Tax=Specibacter cremeus TaxID=1629051 RepID=UPI000F784C96|nr:glutaredoxin family protein [Specibacter cremeus]